MGSAVLTIPDEVKAELKRFSWINWSELARVEVLEQEKKIALLDELDNLTKDSTLTDKDCIEFAKRVKKRLSSR